MAEVSAADPLIQRRRLRFLTLIRESVPSVRETGSAAGSAILLVLSFPNFELWWLAWIGLTPLLFAVARTSRKRTAFVIGLIWGTIFFYGTCWWLTYPMIHHAGLAPWLAYPLLLLPVVFCALFPALACLCISRLIDRFGSFAILAAPGVWITFDWLRSVVTGLDWNALGYSQAFHPTMIQPASLGGVYAITFLILMSNTAIILAIRSRRTEIAIAVALSVVAVIGISAFLATSRRIDPDPPSVVVIAIQPNVPMVNIEALEYAKLTDRHIQMSQQALTDWKARVAVEGYSSFTNENIHTPLLLVWPESPMNFSYTLDPHLRKTVATLAQTHHTSILLNSLEKTTDGGSYNSAILINEQGQKIAQYDKIRLMPFGEYVPLPRWLPGSGSVRSIVGEFTPGNSHTLMPLGALRAGVFICIEAAHADVARSFTNAGADVLINISNDGYLGPTPVMRQHLANATFRAVENHQEVVRVTNAGISSFITIRGAVQEPTSGFREEVRTWIVSKHASGTTFYARYGDVFAYGCALITLGLISVTFMRGRKVSEARP